MNRSKTTTQSDSAVDETRRNGSKSWRRWFALDLRSLAALRIVLGTTLLADLWFRLPNLKAMYTDAGFFSREFRAAWNSAQPEVSQWGWSLHCLSGDAWWQMTLMGLAAIIGVMLTLGLWTRMAVIASWVLLVSLQSRNSLILSSGDTYLKVVMFWSMFLPLAEFWSWDRWWQKKKNRSSPVLAKASEANGFGRFLFASPATAGLILALFTLYFSPGIAKLNDVWFSGDAMEYVLRLDIYATDFGKSMLEYPQLLKWFTWGTLLVEIAVPILLLVFWPSAAMRYFAMACFVGLHIGIALCMEIGMFPYLCSAIWVFVLPSGFWNWIGNRTSSDMNSTAGPTFWQRVDEFFTRSWTSKLFCSSMVVYFLLWNVAHFKNPICKSVMPDQARFVGKALNMRQAFFMFDVPPKHSPWFVYEGRLANGENVDLFRKQAVNHARPESIRKTMPDMQWRRLHRNLVRPHYKPIRKPVSEFVLRDWNEKHDADSQAVMLRTTAHMDEIAVRAELTAELTQVWFQFGQKEIAKQQFDDLLEKIKNGGSLLPD